VVNIRKSIFAKAGLAGAALFLVLLAVLHFIEPEFDPSRHLISEYELGKFGWMMSAAFWSLGIGVLSLVISTWTDIKTIRGFIGRWWFVIIFAAFIGAGIFYPYTTPNIASKIHTACGSIVIFSFPIAATLYGSSLARDQKWSVSRKWLLVTLVWIGFLAFFGSLIIFHPESDADKANLVVGWPNRFMMLTYSIWLILVNQKAILKKEL
jgi:hypothetical protein